MHVATHYKFSVGVLRGVGATSMLTQSLPKPQSSLLVRPTRVVYGKLAPETAPRIGKPPTPMSPKLDHRGVTTHQEHP